MKTHICFHGIGRCGAEREPGEARYWMSEDIFRGVLDALMAEPDVQLSFDDGNRSDADIALPALSERGLTATFFPLAGRLDDPASLDAADLREMREANMSIGTHGWSHVPWRGLSDDDAKRELVEAAQVLAEASGAEITEAALPLGRYDRQLLGRLKDAKYRTVYTSDRFRARESSWLQARYSVTSDDTVASVIDIVRRPTGRAEVRNLLASAAKRVR